MRNSGGLNQGGNRWLMRRHHVLIGLLVNKTKVPMAVGYERRKEIMDENMVLA